MEWLSRLPGLDAEKLSVWQMAARAVLVFLTALVFVRIAWIRTLRRQSAFDDLRALTPGAVMGRVIVKDLKAVFLERSGEITIVE